MLKNKNFVLLDIWISLFVTSLITANIIAVKLIQIGPFILPAGTVIFPISYILGDVLTEVYGYSVSRRVIWLGFLSNLLAVIAIEVALILPAASFWSLQNEFAHMFGLAPRILLASFAGYLVGEFSNSFVLAKIKIYTHGKWLWIRTISSTLIGEGLDTCVFTLIAFFGVIPNNAILTMIITLWLFKTVYEILVTPITYLVVNWAKRVERIDTFDKSTNFNPFRYRKEQNDLPPEN